MLIIPLYRALFARSMSRRAGVRGRETIRVGVGAGFADDRIEPARELALRGALDYLVFECLAERTIARETLTRLGNADLGYTPNMIERLAAVVPACVERQTKIVTNMGAANPLRARTVLRQWARKSGIALGRIAVVQGDDVLDQICKNPDLQMLECGEPVEAILPTITSANAYLGADIVAQALAGGSQVVITGRIADPALFLGCMMHGLGWSYDDYSRLGTGTFAGHLLECGAQLSGGCFADPGCKHVPDLAHLGLPFADINVDGALMLGKLPDTGGRLDIATCSEQTLYEIHDPSAYVTPDCILDLTDVYFSEHGRDRVSVHGARARPRTDSYKVTVGYRAGWQGEGEIGYAGPNALARARLAAEIVRQRLRDSGHAYEDFRVDYIGYSSLHGEIAGTTEPYEVRLRVSGRSTDKKSATAVGFEVKTLNLNGPAGAGGTSAAVREVIGVKSLLLPRSWVHPTVSEEIL